MYVALEMENVILCISHSNQTKVHNTHKSYTLPFNQDCALINASLSFLLSLMTKYSSACASPVGFDSADDTVPVAVLMLFSPKRAP